MSYPNTFDSYTTKINKNASGWFVGPEYFDVPGGSPYEIYLDHVPKDSGTTFIGASGGATWTPTTDYTVDYIYGKVTFDPSKAGLKAQAVYYSLGDDIMAEHMNDVQGSITRIESELGTNPKTVYLNVNDRMNNMDIAISASGINGQRITDGTIRPGAAKSTTEWADNLGAVAPGLTAISTIQDHIDQKGNKPQISTNPHGVSLIEVSDASVDLTAKDIYVSNIYSNGSTIALKNDGPDGAQNIYFYNGAPMAEALSWSNTEGRFRFTGDVRTRGLYAQGSLACSGVAALPTLGVNSITASGVISSNSNIDTTAGAKAATLSASVVAAVNALSFNSATASGGISTSASGSNNIGTVSVPFGTGNFTSINVGGGGFTVGGTSTGATGWFLSADGKYITVHKGIITNII